MARKSKIELSLKLELVQSVIAGHLSQREAAWRAKVNKSTLAAWVRIYRTEGVEGLLPTTKNRVYDPALKKCAVEDYFLVAAVSLRFAKSMEFIPVANYLTGLRCILLMEISLEENPQAAGVP